MASDTVLLCMGTRPEIIKMAPVYHALRETALRPVLLHTGQHGDMAEALYRFFGMEPDLRLDLARERPSLGHLSAQLLDGIDRLVHATEASAMLVHGDTSSTLAAALAGYYGGVPVGHVEAGLRSGDDQNPFPEEMNRRMVARLARWHFTPTQRSTENLRAEGIDAGTVYAVGNTIVDAVQRGLVTLAYQQACSEGLRLFYDDTEAWTGQGRLVLVTAHRRENWGRPIVDVARSVAALTGRHPDLRFLWPLHPNPAVGEAVAHGLGPMLGHPRIRLTQPLSYVQMLWALREAWLALTDSGGLQEEAAALETPVLVLRETTERPEVIEAGAGALVGTDRRLIEGWVDDLAAAPDLHAAMRCETNPYGDGQAALRIAGILQRDLLPASEPPLRLITNEAERAAARLLTSAASSAA